MFTDCKHCNKVYIGIEMKLKEMTLLCLHHEYNTPFIKGIITESIFGYDQLSDHIFLWGKLGDIEITDMTNYPETIIPQKFAIKKMDLDEIETNFSFEKMVTFKPPKNIINFQMTIYDPSCPIRLERNKDMENNRLVNFGELWGVYVQELSHRRIMDYTLNQFMY